MITEATQPPLPDSYDLNLTRVNEEDGESTLIARRVSTESVFACWVQVSLPLFIPPVTKGGWGWGGYLSLAGAATSVIFVATKYDKIL